MSEQKEMGKAFDFGLFKKVMAYSKPYMGIFWLVAIVAILLTSFAVLTPVLVKMVVNDALGQKDGELLFRLVMFMVLVLVGQVGCQLVFNYFASLLGESVIKDLRVQLFNKMLGFKMAYFNTSSVGVLVTRAVADMQRIGEIFSQGFFVIVAELLKMFAAAGIMLYIDWRMALIVFAILPVILIATRLFQQAMKVAFIEVRAQVSNLNSFVQERIAGIKIVQLFNREQIEMQKFRDINAKHRDAWLKTVWYNSIFFPVAEISFSIGIGLVVYFGVIQRIDNQILNDTGSIFAFFFLMDLLFRPLRHIADKFNTLQMGMVAANRVFKIMETDSHIPDCGKTELKEVKGQITFENVKFGYLENQEILHGISFDVKPGETVAIVGSTGAGKSTVISLLNRFYDIWDGSIKIDGVDIRDFKLSSLRSQMAIVLQDVFLFADSIRNNICLKDSSIEQETIEKAAKQIGVHDFIMELPGGYEYNVKERGTMMSSGQRQLLAFLRAYVCDPSILVLDEATSSVDTHTEQLIQKATDKITEGRTSIIIAHRLATIRRADTILVMDAGQIVEKGSHAELLAKGGYYKDLYEAQLMAEEAV